MHQSLDYDIASAIGLATAYETAQLTDLATFIQPPGVFDPAGQPDPTAPYVPVTGFVAIPAKKAPVSNLRIQATEVKALAEIMSSQLVHLLLGGYYPTIKDNTQWRVMIWAQGDDFSTAQQYDVLGAESDSSKQMTRVQCKLTKL